MKKSGVGSFWRGFAQVLKDSFKQAWRGEENLDMVLWLWGVGAYFIDVLIGGFLLDMIGIAMLDAVAGAVFAAYFMWHLVVIRKCSPAKVKLSRKEKKAMHCERRKRAGKDLLDKLLLKKSIVEWNFTHIVVAIDLFFITSHVADILRAFN